ncbi:hypothetical protein A4A49_07633 [Nicotiana attenuata]|uniref:Uncharacterized protein n=1 Tax=Nicotiana attenuata TaxID=49451 RepID=A0A1J6INP9_NICAT|nr:hypothetical protein A4A49_07633 [Nicotiana attenuata]
MSIQHKNEYHRQVRESEGFEITLDLTLNAAIGDPIIPQRDFNSRNATKYEFVKNVTVNTSYAAGMWCYITFQGRDADVDATADDDSNALKTFQALAWWGINGDRDVKFCRFKKPSLVIEGDKRAPDSDVDAKSTQ